jgi:ADP-ribose pyrophosphatase YjhB (NUDIX family)
MITPHESHGINPARINATEVVSVEPKHVTVARLAILDAGMQNVLFWQRASDARRSPNKWELLSDEVTRDEDWAQAVANKTKRNAGIDVSVLTDFITVEQHPRPQHNLLYTSTAAIGRVLVGEPHLTEESRYVSCEWAPLTDLPSVGDITKESQRALLYLNLLNRAGN